MKSRIMRMGLLLAMGLSLSFSTACDRIEPGYGGIVVDLNGEDKGVNEITVKTGRIYYNPFGTAIFQLPTFMQRVAWTQDPAEGSADNEEITFNSVEGTIIKTDVGFAWAVKKDRVPHVFVEFRTTVADITDGYFRSQVRGAIAECAEDKPLDLIYGAGKTEIAKCAFSKVGSVPFIRDNFDLEYLTFIGGFRFDPKVQDAINNKIAAENEKKAAIERALGKAQAIREVAQADRDSKFLAAEGNDRLVKSLTSALLTYEKIQMMREKWDGTMPRAIMGGDSAALLSLNIE